MTTDNYIDPVEQEMAEQAEVASQQQAEEVIELLEAEYSES